jgi:F-type H+-transporting ATPase subunit delta
VKAKRQVTRTTRQLFRLCLVHGALDQDRVRQVARRLVESRRRGALAILSTFLRQVRLDRDRHAALIESAAPLPGAVRERIETALRRIYGSNMTVSFADNAALIGGVRIKVGSDVYDDSVRARLAALEARLGPELAGSRRAGSR